MRTSAPATESKAPADDFNGKQNVSATKPAVAPTGFGAKIRSFFPSGKK
jgi:hypothetical protein